MTEKLHKMDSRGQGEAAERTAPHLLYPQGVHVLLNEKRILLLNEKPQKKVACFLPVFGLYNIYRTWPSEEILGSITVIFIRSPDVFSRPISRQNTTDMSMLNSHIVCLHPPLSTTIHLLCVRWQHRAAPAGSSDGIQSQLRHIIIL